MAQGAPKNKSKKPQSALLKSKASKHKPQKVKSTKINQLQRKLTAQVNTKNEILLAAKAHATGNLSILRNAAKLAKVEEKKNGKKGNANPSAEIIKKKK